MFEKLYNSWRDKGFEYTLIASIIIILFLAIFRFGKKGTYNWIPLSDWIRPLPPPQHRQTFSKKNTESKGELECRRVLQELFKRPFNKKRPDFLRNSVTGNTQNLELDCFCEDLKLAVEYNGVQHYKYTPFFHRNKDAFMNQKYRDELKRRMCKDNDIILIEVPYTININDIKSYIVGELKQKMNERKKII